MAKPTKTACDSVQPVHESVVNADIIVARVGQRLEPMRKQMDWDRDTIIMSESDILVAQYNAFLAIINYQNNHPECQCAVTQS